MRWSLSCLCGELHKREHGEQPARKSLEATTGHLIEWSQVRSRSLLLLLAALASTVVAATASADWKRGLDAIVTKLQTNDDASALVQDVDTVTALGRKASYLSV